MTIRRASKDDAEAISALNREVQALHAEGVPAVFKPPAEDSFSPERVRSLMEATGVRMWIAVVDAVPAGYIYAELSRQSENSLRKPHSYIYVNHICVADTQRRKGIGRQLLLAAQTWAQEEQVDALMLDVWGFNTAAQVFFAREGFAPFTIRMSKPIA
jgi:ribosomal protein S18 acetylase RimI-like enzyme